MALGALGDDFGDLDPAWQPQFGADDLAPDATVAPPTPTPPPMPAIRTASFGGGWLRENAPVLIAAGAGVFAGLLILKGHTDWKRKGLAVGGGALVTLIALRVLRP